MTSRPFRKKPTGFIIFQQAEPSSSLRLSTKGTRQSLTRAPIPSSPRRLWTTCREILGASQGTLPHAQLVLQSNWVDEKTSDIQQQESATTSPLFQRIPPGLDANRLKSTTLFSSGSYRLFILRLNGMSPCVRDNWGTRLQNRRKSFGRASWLLFTERTISPRIASRRSHPMIKQSSFVDAEMNPTRPSPSPLQRGNTSLGDGKPGNW